jgi:peptidoglycan glycosyltransferase
VNVALRRAAYVLLAAFVVLAGTVTYIQAFNASEYRDDPRNPRLVAWRTGRERGPIVTSDQVVVALSRPSTVDRSLFQREYPEGDLYAHTVGYTSVLFGSRGLERAHASELTSDRDSTISGVLNGILGGDTRPRGLRLTIDHTLQTVAAEALGNQRGAVVAIDPMTGAVLALVSSPSFDPNTLLGPDAFDAGKTLEDDPNEPLRNRVSDETYAPGSVFKIVTTAAGLDTGLVSPSTMFNDPVELALPGSDSTIKNFDGEPCAEGTQVSLEYAFVHSCNTTFAQLGMDLGGARLGNAADRFGFNAEIPFDLPTLTSFFPSDGSIDNNPPATAQSAIGQLDVQTTPLLMALSGSAVANGGTIMVPYLVYDVFTSDGTVESSTAPKQWRRAMSPATASVLTNLMEQVVVSGTGRKAAVPGVRIAGKTGTAEVSGAAPHAWFVGFGPIDPQPGDPSIVVAVAVESGGDFGESATGGSVAAPIAQKVLASFFGVG